MDYNDYKLCNERESRMMSSSYTELKALEVQDLVELRDKMTEQKSMLIFSNLDGKLNDAISTTSSNIEMINKLIGKVSQNHVISASTKGRLSRALTSQPDTYGKYPSQAEMDRMDRLNNPPINNTSPPQIDGSDVTPPLSPPPNEGQNVTTTRKRRSPMQGTILDAIAKSLFVKGRKSRNCEIVADERKNRFHNGIGKASTQLYSYTECNECSPCLEPKWDHHNTHHGYPPHHIRPDCNPHDKMVTGQIDLLRLLVLFISLHPHCGFNTKICNIATEQFDVLLSII